MNLPVKSLQFSQNAQGMWGADAFPGVPAMAIDDPQPVRDWLAELDLPKDRAKLDLMAQPRGLSTRRLFFIVADESETLFPGAPRTQTRQWILKPDGYAFTLSHIGYAIGLVSHLRPAKPGDLSHTQIEGVAILAEAQLYASPLADAAWRGIAQGIFAHVCGVVRYLRFPTASGVVAVDELLEVALIDRAACRNAKILKVWEGAAE